MLSNLIIRSGRAFAAGLPVFAAIAAFAAPARAAELKVVTTTTTLKSIVQAIGGDRVSVKSITKGPQDPHFVEAKPSYMVDLRSADLLVAVGLDLEVGWLPNVSRGARNPGVLPGAKGYLETGSVIDPIEVPHGKVDRAEGDVHPAGNPHYYLDPQRTLKAARAVKDRLVQLDSAGRAQYEAGYSAFKRDLEARLADWQARVKKARVDKAVTYHKTLNYFFDRFGLKQAGAIEPKPGIPPTAKHVLSLIRKIRDERIPCILVESFFERDAAERIRKSVPVFVKGVPVEVEALEGAKDYFALIESIVTAVEECGRWQATRDDAAAGGRE